MKLEVIQSHFRAILKSSHVMTLAFVFFICPSLLPLFAAEPGVAVSSGEVVDISEFTAHYAEEQLPTLRIDKISMSKHISEVSSAGYHDMLLIDISPSVKYDMKHLDGAVSVPMTDIGINGQLTARLKELEREKETNNYRLWVRVYSHNSVKEAKEAAKKFVLVGLKYVSYLDFTLDEWQKAGRPIVSRVSNVERAVAKRPPKEPGNTIVPVDKNKSSVLNSLGIDPGEIAIESYLPLGKTIAVSEVFGKKIKITNYDTEAHKYDIGIFTCAEKGAKPKEGFEDIPDATWAQPEFKEIEVSGNSAREVEIYIKVPDKSKLLNKKYEAVFEAKSQKEKEGDLFIVAVDILMTFRTDKYEDKLSFTMVSDGSINTGADYSSELIFLNNLPSRYSDMKIEKVDYSSAKGQQLVKDNDIAFLPAYIFNKPIELLTDFGELMKRNSFVKTKTGNYLYSSKSRPGIFINRKRVPKLLEIFYPPDTRMTANQNNKVTNTQNFIKEAIALRKNGKIPNEIKLKFTALLPSANYMSPLGGEGTSDMNDLDPQHLNQGVLAYVQKYQPDKFYDFLLLSTEDDGSAEWETKAAPHAGLSVDDIKKAISSGEVKKLLDEDVEEMKGLQLDNAVQTVYILYENRVLLLDPKLLNHFADFKYANIKTTRLCCGNAGSNTGSGAPATGSPQPATPLPNINAPGRTIPASDTSAPPRGETPKQ